MGDKIITVLLLLITPPSLIEYFEIQRILGNINRVPRNSGVLGEIAREAREKKWIFLVLQGKIAPKRSKNDLEI